MGDWLDDIVCNGLGTEVRTQPTPPANSPPEPDQEEERKREPEEQTPNKGITVLPGQVFHSYQGASWLALWTLLGTWVISPLTVVALYDRITGASKPTDWSLFHGVAAWFADTMENLWITGEMGSVLPYAIFGTAAVWLLDRRSRVGLRVGVAVVAVYIGGTWYAQNYGWYPNWAAWHGDWTGVQLTALFATAAAGVLYLIRFREAYGKLTEIPQWKTLLCVLPISAIVYGLLMTSTNAAF